MIWFTADTHFNHSNIIRYCNRPYQNINDMNRDIMEKWIKVVKPNDTIYHLGDFGFGNLSGILDRLPGKIRLIKGSHDKSALRFKGKFEYISPLVEVGIEGITVVMCHYAMRTWHKSHFNSWHLYGHSHGTLPPIGKSWDVGVDNNGFIPLSWEQIKEIMAKRPDNPNLVKKHEIY